MYPFLQLGKTIAKSAVARVKGEKLSLTDTSEIHLKAKIHDIDNFLEMNNGRIFTLFDLGRMDFAIRSGLGVQLVKHRWGMVVAGSTIQYRKRVRLNDELTIKTRLVGIDERWIYIEQTMWVAEHATSMALLRTGITNFATGKTMPIKTVLDAMGYHDFTLPPDEWVQAWIAADKLRPFPKPVIKGN